MTEKELIKLCIEGNRHAQEKLYRKFADKMFTVCMYYSNDRDLACDFLQEGFIIVFRKLDQFSCAGSLEGWIRRIIVTTALQYYRKANKEPYKVELIDNIAIEETEESEDYNRISPKEVIRLVNELPKKAALVMKLYALEGYSHQEIAEQLDISVGTSKSQLNRARQLLRVSFSKRND